MPDTSAQQPVLVIMGVAGCGKSTVAALLAGQLGWDFQEGDDLHSAENVEKMASGLLYRCHGVITTAAIALIRPPRRKSMYFFSSGRLLSLFQTSALICVSSVTTTMPRPPST